MPTRKRRSDSPSLRSQLIREGAKTAYDLELQEKRIEAVILRQSGLSYPEIGEQLGIAAPTARKYVLTELANRREESGEDLESIRDLELERLDKITNTYWPKMLKGDKFATSLIMQTMERRSAYLGLDAPKRTEFIGAVATLDVEKAKSMTDEDLRQQAIRITQRVLGVATTQEPQKK